MKKLKLKKGAQKTIIIGLIVLLFLGIGMYSFIKIKNKMAYEKTYEYKLLNAGYSDDDVKDLIKTYKDKELEYILTNKSDLYVTLSQDKYFIYDKFYNYIDYAKEHEDLNIRSIVEKVNTNTSKEYYTDSQETDVSKNELMLVNKYYYLSDTYVPKDLVTIPPTYSYGEYGSQQINQDAYVAFLSLWNASHEAGFYLMVNSSYRTHEKQQSVYDDYKNSRGVEYADKIAARPGYSEHQTGYSIDVFEKGTSQSNFQDTDSYKWLKENAHKYGFIERYPADKVDTTGYEFESWHYRYVGVNAATYIYENNITFDEYYAYFVK